MNARLHLLLPLAPLFTALLAGCSSYSSCDGFKGGTYDRTVELSPAEYAQWKMGIPPGSSSTGVATSTTDGTSGSTGGTAGETGADPTTGANTMLTDQEICMMVCVKESIVGNVESCTIGPINANGNIPVECVLPAFCEGRRHACVRSHGDAEQSNAATWLARAADDERRHAALIGALAEQHGATVPAIVIAPTPTRDLLALAVENIVEGCVRETWAALSAAHQARSADTAALRNLYQDIAADEAQHAELAWSIHTWLIGQLNAAEQAMVAAARRAAVRQLQTSLAALADEPELLALGIPGRNTALHLLAGLDAALWSQAA